MVNVKFTEFAFVSDGTSTTRTQPSRNAQYIMLEDFGGAGDSTTDNVAAFNLAVAALGIQAVVIHLDPTKGYAFNSSITLPVNWTIDGHVNSLQSPLPGRNSWNSANAKAVNYVKFTKNPTANETITLNGTAVTFVAGAAVGNQVQIAVDMNTTVTNLKTFLNASADAQISKCTYASGNWLTANLQSNGVTFAVLEATFDTVGTSGNSFTFATLSNTAPFQACGGPASTFGGETQLAAATNSTTLRYGGLPTLGGTIILNSGASLLYRRGGCVKNAIVVNGAIPAIYAGPVNMLANVAAFSGTAIAFDPSFATTPPNAFTTEASFRNLMIIGFDTALTCNQFSRGVIESIKLDCTHGINVNATFDIFDITRARANSFYTVFYNGSLLFVDPSYRKGVFIHIHDGASFPRIINPFSYGHAIKYLCGNEVEVVWDVPSCDGPGTATTTPALLDVTVTNGGAGYATGTTAAFSTVNGSVLAVTLTTTGGTINGITVLDPGTWTGNEAVPTVVLSNAGAGVTVTATFTVAFIKSIGYSTYGSLDRVSYNSAGADVQSKPMKFDAIGTHSVNGPMLPVPGGAGTSSIFRGAATTVRTAGIFSIPPVASVIGQLGGAMVFSGIGDPNTVVTAGIGSLYMRTDVGGNLTTLYVKQSGTGNTGWIGK